MQALHKIVHYSSAGDIRTADVFLDLDCNLYRVVFNDGEASKSFPNQALAESVAQAFVNCEACYA